MIRKILAAVVAASFANAALAAAPVKGFWRTIDDKTKNPKSVVRLYDCGENLCGRIVALYDSEGAAIAETFEAPVKVAEKVDGKPHIAGLDIIWGMKWDGKEFSGGRILDPQSGSVYSSVIWQTAEDAEAGRLRVRGKIGPFGRTQTWEAAEQPAELKSVDVSAWTPVVVK